jgi:membrane protein YqaA with SNARE-associated domain
MLDWIAEKILAIVTFVPALFVPEGSPTFMAVRAMFGLILIVLVAYLIAMQPFRSTIAYYLGRPLICSSGNDEIEASVRRTS